MGWSDPTVRRAERRSPCWLVAGLGPSSFPHLTRGCPQTAGVTCRGTSRGGSTPPQPLYPSFQVSPRIIPPAGFALGRRSPPLAGLLGSPKRSAPLWTLLSQPDLSLSLPQASLAQLPPPSLPAQPENSTEASLNPPAASPLHPFAAAASGLCQWGTNRPWNPTGRGGVAGARLVGQRGGAEGGTCQMG